MDNSINAISTNVLNNTGLINNDQYNLNNIKGAGNQKAQLKKVGEEFETMFLTKMKQTMDKTVDREGGLLGEESRYVDTFKNHVYQEVSRQLTQSQAIKMVISQPTTFEQSDEICGFLKEKKSVIVNLEYVNKDVARRIVDFISGGVYALDGYIQKVSNSIFLVAPSNYEITNEMAREEMKSKLSVSWLKNNNVNN